MEARELFKEAQLLFMQGKHRESIGAFTRALDAGAEPFICCLSRGAAHIQLKEPEMAIEDFTRAIEADGKNARAYYYRGTAYMLKEDYERAIADFGRAIELKPDHGAAFFARGTCYAQVGKDEEATRDLKTAISYSEASIQGFVDTFGILRTQFDGVLALISGERRHPSVELTDEETAKLKKWLEGAEE
jgi:tetratricopeptide (TPR) repeat protein